MSSRVVEARSGGRPAVSLGRLAPELRKARMALTLVFFLLGGLAATWAARIPAVKGALHLSAGALGVALLGPAVGLVASTAPTGAALTRFRPRTVIAAGLAVYAISLPWAALAGSTAVLFVVLLAWGVGAGMVDVAMNTEAAALQGLAGRPIMSGLHASYSVGGLVGAGIGAAVAAANVAVGWHLVVASALTAAGGVVAVAALGPTASAAPRRDRRHGHQMPRPSWTLAALAVVAFGCFLAEGAANDWSAVYLHGSLGASAGFAALGYTVFASTMTAGRLIGDRLGHAVGAVRLVRVSALVAAAGFGTSLLSGRPVVGLIGFGVLGLGLSFVVPLVFSAAPRLGAAGPSLALVTSCGYIGLMAGPPLIGAIADVTGLAAALVVVVAVAVTAAVLAPALDAGNGPPGYGPAGYGSGDRTPGGGDDGGDDDDDDDDDDGGGGGGENPR
ncbi:MFS transporter [Acidiferrimicrobium sp. IK]|uniref:MFS transporter n=1 Tax=Acidiferrimicrobium sp. IK TaxID=2871700 RepID=UPI0021CB76FE|nr:MFS transporter [Acidiferrimicrobium sp. IK]MCU4186158.1 MFS transporter [Acidiferrimicrobium sp. IK]